MKACPFCAEEIQDAAIVCRHCHRALTPSQTKIWGTRFAALAVLILALWVGTWLVDWSKKYSVFEARRVAWHRQCDEFVGKTIAEIDAIYKPGAADDRRIACQQELESMTTYAKQQGW